MYFTLSVRTKEEVATQEEVKEPNTTKRAITVTVKIILILFIFDTATLATLALKCRTVEGVPERFAYIEIVRQRCALSRVKM